jgi:hypothetical protein
MTNYVTYIDAIYLCVCIYVRTCVRMCLCVWTQQFVLKGMEEFFGIQYQVDASGGHWDSIL